MSFLSKIFGDANERYLKKLRPLLKKINSYDEQFSKLSDDELRAKTDEFKDRFLKGATLDELLPENKETILHSLFTHNQRDKILALGTALLLRIILIGK